jgi:alpha-L-fucosidase
MKVFSVPSLCGTLLAYFGSTSSPLVPFPSTPITLSSYFDNQAASIDGTTGNFNKRGSTYAAEYLPTGPWLFNSVTVNLLILFIRGGLNLYLQYDLPTSWGTGDDNVISQGQVIELPSETYVHELHLLYAGDGTDG